MKNPSRNLLVMLKNQLSQQAIEHEVECLNEILLEMESLQHFYSVHELVNRNKITSNPKKILNAIRRSELKPFRFLINKN